MLNLSETLSEKSSSIIDQLMLSLNSREHKDFLQLKFVEGKEMNEAASRGARHLVKIPGDRDKIATVVRIVNKTRNT